MDNKLSDLIISEFNVNLEINIKLQTDNYVKYKQKFRDYQ